MDVATRNGAQIIPIDSEHNAIFQCLPAAGERFKGVRRLLLTASGGPFRGRQRAELESITPDQACADRKSVVEGKSVSVRLDLGGRRTITKQKPPHQKLPHTTHTTHHNTTP